MRTILHCWSPVLGPSVSLCPLTRCDSARALPGWIASPVLFHCGKNNSGLCLASMKAFPPVKGLVRTCEISTRGAWAPGVGQLFIQYHLLVLGRDILNMIHMCYILSGAAESRPSVCGAAGSCRVELARVCVRTAGTWPCALCVIEETWRAVQKEGCIKEQNKCTALRQIHILFYCV